MKKTILALLLTLAMIVCFGAFTVSAEETAHEHCVCNGTVSGNDAHTCESVTWTPISVALEEAGLTTETANFGKLPSGNYYLDTDIIVTAYSNIGTSTVVYKKNAEGQYLDIDGNVTTNSNYYVTVTRTFSNEKDIAIDLNGHNITTTSARTFGNLYYGSKLTITDWPRISLYMPPRFALAIKSIFAAPVMRHHLRQQQYRLCHLYICRIYL